MAIKYAQEFQAPCLVCKRVVGVLSSSEGAGLWISTHLLTSVDGAQASGLCAGSLSAYVSTRPAKPKGQGQ